MTLKVFKRYYVLLILLLSGTISYGQNVPLGIFYQAVARDNVGKELANKKIDVNFLLSRGIRLEQLFIRSFIPMLLLQNMVYFH